MRLAGFEEGERSSIEPVLARLAVYPNLRFKLDPFQRLGRRADRGRLVATGAVDSLDLKGFYKDTPVDVITDPELYAKLVAAFPDAWLEDPDVTDETRPILDPVHERVTWDAPIHSIADIVAMPWSPPRDGSTSSPRAFSGPIRHLFAAYDYCEERRIGAYGGGQTELGPGPRAESSTWPRSSIPTPPTTSAPGGYNNPELATKPGLPSSPLEPAIDFARLSLAHLNPPDKETPMPEKTFAEALKRADRQRVSPPPSSTSASPSTTTPKRCPAWPPSSYRPGARGARARDDDDPLPARRRRGGPTSPDIRRQGQRPTPTAVPRSRWRSSRRSGSATRSSRSSSSPARFKDYRAEQFMQWFVKEQVEGGGADGRSPQTSSSARRRNLLLAEDYIAREGPRRGGQRPNRAARRRRVGRRPQNLFHAGSPGATARRAMGRLRLSTIVVYLPPLACGAMGWGGDPPRRRRPVGMAESFPTPLRRPPKWSAGPDGNVWFTCFTHGDLRRANQHRPHPRRPGK